MFGYLVGLVWFLGIWVIIYFFSFRYLGLDFFFLFVFVLNIRIKMVLGYSVIDFTICILCCQPCLLCWMLLLSLQQFEPKQVCIVLDISYMIYSILIYLFIGLLLDVSLHMFYLNFLQYILFEFSSIYLFNGILQWSTWRLINIIYIFSFFLYCFFSVW